MEINTPKALANFSPELERSDNSGLELLKAAVNPEGVPLAANPVRVGVSFDGPTPGLSLRSNPGLKLVNAFGVVVCRGISTEVST
jgi:hypothetical protein